MQHFASDYNGIMTDEERLEQHLDLCKQVYKRMKREGTWLWPDSSNFEDMVESEDSNKTS
ncbi:MAG: hypothetical protein AAGG57_11525 [Pseudomonadota bacterium]